MRSWHARSGALLWLIAASAARADPAPATQPAPDRVWAVDALRARVDALEEQLSEAQAAAEDARAMAASAAAIVSPGDAGVDATGGPVLADEAAAPFGLRDERGLLLGVHGLVQLRYDGGRGVVGGPVSSFTLPRAQLAVDGRVYSPRLRYRLMVDGGGETIRTYPSATGSTSAGAQQRVLRDAYFDLALGGWLSVRVGQMLPPTGRERLVAARSFLFGERAASVYDLGFSYDQGVMAHGAIDEGAISWAAGLFNGNGPDIAGRYSGAPGGGRAGHIDFLYAGRMVVAPFGAVPMIDADFAGSPLRAAVGLSGAYDLVPDPAAPVPGTNMAVEQLEADVAALGMGASFQAEGAVRRLVPGLGLPAATYRGGYAQGGYFVVPARLCAGARVAVDEPGGQLPPAAPLLVWQLVAEGELAYYRFGDGVRATLSAGWERDHTLSGARQDGLRVETMAQVAF